MNPSLAGLTMVNNYFSELQEKRAKVLEFKQENQPEQQVQSPSFSIQNVPVTVAPNVVQFNRSDTHAQPEGRQPVKQKFKKHTNVKGVNVAKSQTIKQIFITPPPPPLPPLPAPFITPPVYKVNAGTWNESCFGTGKAERLSCGGTKIPLLCGCQQRVSQTWCAAKCGGMYQFPMNTPGSASVSFVTFY